MIEGIHAEELSVGEGVRVAPGVRVSGRRGEKARRVTLGDGAVLESGVCIEASEVTIGRGALIQHDCVIESRGEDPVRVELGDRVFLGYDGHVMCGGLFVGDYTRLHNHLFLNGPGTLHVGHNCWVGGNCILDGQGALLIGDNVGIGAHSQLWSHIEFGDVLAGCRFHSRSRLVVEEDVWFVGHCIVSPIRARKRSMAMVGSVVTRDMEENHVYAGVPARDVTVTFGPQFDPPSAEQRLERLAEYLDEFHAAHPEHRKGSIVGVAEWDDRAYADTTQLNVMERAYTKRSTAAEQDFLAWVTPTRAKFVPRGWECPSRKAE
jgi:acetyltransferase-like isoleucine patch superfamily enzyme